MEVITIEKQVYETLLQKIETLSSRTDLLFELNNDKSLKQWIDSQEVCNIIRLSKRQLQTYRENGTVSYSQVNHKIYYRPQDLQKLIEKHTTNSSCQK